MNANIIQNKNLPVYKLVIDDLEAGVNFVSMVDNPATDKMWMAFNEHKKFKFFTNEEKRLVSGPLMVAGLPIYRHDDMGEYYVVFDAETILKIVKRFSKQGNYSNVNLMHDSNRQIKGVYMIESLIIDKQRGISAPEGFGELTDGSWFGTYFVENSQVWNDIKNGIFRGFSVEGIFEHKYLTDTSEDKLQSIHERLINLRKMLETK